MIIDHCNYNNNEKVCKLAILQKYEIWYEQMLLEK